MRVSPRTSARGTHGIRQRARPSVPAEDSPPRLWPHILGAWAATIVGVSLIGAGVLWFLEFPEIDRPQQISVSSLDALATRAFAVVAGLSGIALLVIAYHRQRNNNQANLRAQKAAEREDIKLFNDRFTAAYVELGGEHAAIRLGAVHALAHLADDAPTPELRQTCIDVLCAYVRMPHEPEPAPGADPAVDEGALVLPGGPTVRRAEEEQSGQSESGPLREVRRSIVRVISDRLRQADHPWQGHNFDFTGAVFHGGHFRRLDLTSGHLNFNEARFDGGEVDFRYSRFGRATVSFRRARFNGGTVNFRHSRLEGVYYSMSGNRGDDPDAARRQGTHVDFARARFDGSDVLFHDCLFAEGGASFLRSEFVSGSVEFARDGEEEASGTPPFALLDAVAEGEPGVVLLPRAWTENGGAENHEEKRREERNGNDLAYAPGSTSSPENPPPG